MTIEELKEMQRKNHYSFVASSKDYLYTANDSGTTPILYKAVKHRYYFKDAVILECRVGKATAILLARSRIQYLHAHVISRPAKEILDHYHICYTYDHEVEYIENVCKDCICSMEEDLLEIHDLDEGFKIIVQHLSQSMNSLMWKLAA